MLAIIFTVIVFFAIAGHVRRSNLRRAIKANPQARHFDREGNVLG
jgi:hypothetical protein